MSTPENQEQLTKNQTCIRLQAHCSSLILDSAYNQYDIQWTRLSTMQQSASSILVLISIIFGIMVAVLTQDTLVKDVVSYLGNFKYSFYVSIIFSIIYLTLTVYFVLSVIWPKTTQKLDNPSKLNIDFWDKTKKDFEEHNDYETAVSFSTNLLVNQLSKTIEIIEIILISNQKKYFKSLISGVLSLFCTIVVLLHVVLFKLSGSELILTINSIFGYLLTLGIIYIMLSNPKYEDK